MADSSQLDSLGNVFGGVNRHSTDDAKVGLPGMSDRASLPLPAPAATHGCVDFLAGFSSGSDTVEEPVIDEVKQDENNALHSIELSSQVPIKCSGFYAFSGPVFGCRYLGNFSMSVYVRDVQDRKRVEIFTKAFIASLGGIQDPFPGISTEQLQKASRLGKVLDRMNRSSFASERSNACRIIQRNLADLAMDLDDLRKVHGSLSPGPDADAKTAVYVFRTDRCWRKQRQWFDDLVKAISKPLGLYLACSTFGTVCQDGSILHGGLVETLAAGVVVAKIADAAMRAAPSTYTEDHFCAGFCREMSQECQDQDAEKLAAARLKHQKAKDWSDQYLVPFDGQSMKTSDVDSSAARAGAISARKRKAEFEIALGSIDKYKLRALGC
eukprot:TRINITY_DN81165_c0_g1_i1.p1 TRINITY_DN81165_c0_g1~~TRINITY_DN81165_c0_g1_i1.p1  ORF type:complete len:382 (-),score=62.25 TRINITY_DN81165_c0_g1_i1:339-1484(-)